MKREPVTLDGGLVLRRAAAGDVAAVVNLLAADQLGATRDGGALAPYERAFVRIDGDPGELLVVVSDGPEVVATMQLSLLPGLARRGALRMQVEAVRVAERLRGSGVGAAMMTWAVAVAREEGCALVQLTTDKSRVDAHRFYDRLGFVASHEGYKLHLGSEDG